jgi:magnesium-transporting ATPase (P-type)
MENNLAFIWFFVGLLPIIVLWDVVWRGVSLWRAGRNGQKYWFVALLLVNSLGILPIIYLKFFQKIPKKANQK